MTRTQRVYLVVRSNGDVRAVKRPRLTTDEIAISIDLTFAAGWGKVTQSFAVQMPDPPVANEPAAS